MCVWHQTECEAPGCERRWSVWAWQHLHNTNGSDKEDVLQCEGRVFAIQQPSPHCANINWHTVTRGRRAADPDTETRHLHLHHHPHAAAHCVPLLSGVWCVVATLETSSSITGQTSPRHSRQHDAVSVHVIRPITANGVRLCSALNCSKLCYRPHPRTLSSPARGSANWFLM